jgi:hypothetical protein
MAFSSDLPRQFDHFEDARVGFIDLGMVGRLTGHEKADVSALTLVTGIRPTPPATWPP